MANSSEENSPSPPNNNPQNTSIDNAGGSPPPPETTEAIQGLNSSPSSLPSPTPPPAIPSRPGGSSGESKNKKRAKKSGDSVEDQKESGQKKKRREMDAPAGDPICCICGKKFGSWKGVFGHFRAHTKSRDWRGAFPPPTADMLAWLPRNLPPEHTLAPTLLRLARETLAKMRQENLNSGAGSSSGTATTGFDLNKEPPEEPDSVQAGPSFPALLPPPQDGGEDGGLDLNHPPTEEMIDGEMDDGDVGEEGASMNE